MSPASHSSLFPCHDLSSPEHGGLRAAPRSSSLRTAKVAFFFDSHTDETYANSVEIYLERLEPRYVAAQDEGLAWDQLPDDEPFTHPKPLR